MGRAARKIELSPGEAVIAFAEQLLLVPEGMHVGQRIVLREWQRDIIREIYDSDTRRAIVSMGRKNGKTALVAILLLAHIVGPAARQNAQIFSAAQSREQASIVFGYAAKMARMSREIAPHMVVRDSAKELFSPLTGVRYKALSADATTAYGFSPVLVIHDELGQVKGPRSELYDALETAMGAQAAPLSLIVSTQAPEDADLLSMLIDDAAGGHDPATKLFLYAAGAEDDISSEDTWFKANPALGDFRGMKEMREAAQRAMRMPASEAAFRNLYLNQRVAAEGAFLSASVWAQNAAAPDLDLFTDGRPVYGGLDLSMRTDLTALVLACRDDDGDTHVWPHFWVPGSGIHERAHRDRVPYDIWRDRGQLTATPGKTVDYAFVATALGDLARSCNIAQIRFDRYRIDDLRRELDRAEVSVPMEAHGQGYVSMAPALDKLEAEAINGRLRHGNHPVLTWNASNAIAIRDPAGNRKLDKSKSTGRIDGMVALAMALAAIGTEEETPAESIYEVLARQRTQEQASA